MRAMVLTELSDLRSTPEPLRMMDLPLPQAGDEEILIRVSVCGVCHTELDEIEGRTPPPSLPVVLGHQVVGTVSALGKGVSTCAVGDRVGVAWIHSACGTCEFCTSGQENLCPDFRATGRDANGGYAEYMTVPANFAYAIPAPLSDAQAAPLLCAGAIGYRSLRLAGIKDGQRLGLTGFGASGHLVLKLARFLYPQTDVAVFARSTVEQEHARELGAVWAGGSSDTPPDPLQAVIDTTPVWKPVVEALRNLRPGGRLVINAIRKEDLDKEELLALRYPEHLWLEKEIKSVANVARRDVSEFLAVATKAHILPDVEEYPLEQANRALKELKAGKIRGAKLLRVQRD